MKISSTDVDVSNRGVSPMWPSEELASRLYDLANLGLIVGLVIGVVATILIVWMGNTKESYLRTQVAAANASSALANERAENARVRAANLELEALSLRAELLRQGPRENLLQGDNRNKFLNALKPFAGQKIEVRYGLSPYYLPNTSAEPITSDAAGLAKSLNAVLREAHWVCPPIPFISTFQGDGMNVQISPNAPDSTIKAASALLKALKAVPLAATGPFKIANNERKGTARYFEPAVPGGPALEVTLPEQTDETIVLVILAHPN